MQLRIMYIMLNRISNQVDIPVRISAAGVFINLAWLRFMSCIKSLMRPTGVTGIAGANTSCKLLYIYISKCYGIYVESSFNDEYPYDGTHALRLYVFPMHHAPTCFVRMGAEVARHLTSGLAYVQDERYAAGAGMRTTAGMHFG
jgi:hypothetical protein